MGSWQYEKERVLCRRVKIPLNFNKFVLNLVGRVPLNFMRLCKEVEKVNRDGDAEGVVMAPCIETRGWPV